MTGQQHYTANQMRDIDRTQWCKRPIVGDHIQYINIRDNPADGLTKTLGRIMHNEHVYRALELYSSLHKFGESCTMSMFIIEQWNYTAVRTNLAAIKIRIRKITVTRMNSIFGN